MTTLIFLAASVSLTQGISLQQAIQIAKDFRTAVITVNPSNSSPNPASTLQVYRADTEESEYEVSFEDGWYVHILKSNGKVTFFSAGASAPYYAPLTGTLLTNEVLLSQFNSYYQIMGHSNPLIIDSVEDYVGGPSIGFRWIHFLPTLNNIPFTRDYSIPVRVHPGSGQVCEMTTYALPNVDTSMTPVLTVTQARAALVGYLFAHSNVTEVEETEYDVRLRWGQAPLADELNEDVYTPGPDIATLRATNTALLMYDVRYNDINYSSPKGGGAIYRVIMDARNGQVVGMDGPVIGMFGEGEQPKKFPPIWNYGPGPMSVIKGKNESVCFGSISQLDKPSSKPSGIPVVLKWGKHYVKASYSAKENILWKRNPSGIAAGTPSKEIQLVLQKMTCTKSK